MGFTNNEKEPQMIYEVGSKDTTGDLEKISRWVNNINKDLRDSGFEEHQARVELIGDAAYIKRL
jgi:hypothetical protein